MAATPFTAPRNVWAPGVDEHLRPVSPFNITTQTYFGVVQTVSRSLKQAGLAQAAQQFAASAEALGRETDHDTGMLYLLALDYVRSPDTPQEDK